MLRLAHETVVFLKGFVGVCIPFGGDPRFPALPRLDDRIDKSYGLRKPDATEIRSRGLAIMVLFEKPPRALSLKKRLKLRSRDGIHEELQNGAEKLQRIFR